MSLAYLTFLAATLLTVTQSCKRDGPSGAQRSGATPPTEVGPPAPAAPETNSGEAAKPGDDFVAGEPPAMITGINLTQLDVDNARIRCDFVPVDGELHRILCRAAVITPGGMEVLATSVATGVAVSWPAPSVLGGKAEVAACNVAPNALSQSCDVRLQDRTAKISLSLDVREVVTGRARVEKAIVLLPYSVGIAAGFVAAIPYLYLTGTEDLLALADDAPKPTGMQPISAPAERFQVAAFDACESNGRLFVMNGGMIRVLEGGALSHYAGSADASSWTDYSDRRRVTLIDSKLVCAADALYVARFSYGNPGDLLKLNAKGPVEIVASGLAIPVDLTRGGNGTFYLREADAKRIVGIVPGRPPEVLIEDGARTSLGSFAVNAAGDILYHETSFLPETHYLIKLRAASGVTTQVNTDSASRFCSRNGCAINFQSLTAIGKSFFALGPSYEDGSAAIYELSDASAPRLVHHLAMSAKNLFTDGTSLLVGTGDQILRVAPDGATTRLAGRDAERQLATDGPATDAQFIPARIALGPNGEVLIADESVDANTIRFIDAGGTIHALNDLRDRNEVLAPAFAADGSLLFVDGGALYQRSADGVVKQVGAMSAAFGDLVGGKEEVVSLVTHGDDLYAMSPHFITRRHAGGEPTVVAGLRTANVEAVAKTHGEGQPAATHAEFGDAVSLAVGNEGSLYFIDNGLPRLLKVDRDGILSTIVDGDKGGYEDLVGVAVANDGTVFLADGGGAVDLFVPNPVGGGAAYTVEPLIQRAVRRDCGTGRVRKQATAETIDGAIRASLSVMCIGAIRSIAIDDTCPAEGGRTRIMIGQEFYDFGNLIEIIRPCRKPVP